MSILKEFKDFAVKGNVIDMAVGIIIGGAFGKIVTSLVNDIIMPPIGVLLGGVNFSDLKFIVQEANVDNNISEVAINYGSFFQVILDFLIVAFCIFMVIRTMNKLKKKEVVEEAAAVEATPSKEEVLLTEIRDLLKK
jgi:large conductance mechanosensitive channel